VIDTHAHLDPAEAPAVLERARAAGVDRVVVVATTVSQASEVLALAEAHEGVYACLGVHPHEAGSPGDLGELQRLLRHDRAVAVGETGLDYFRDYAPREAQRQLFQLELELAGNSGKPVVIHPKAPELREVAARVPDDRLLAETDSPYLAPQPVRGKRNEPANVVHTVDALAAARGEDAAELGRMIDANATVAFQL
jgi:TatD DNase family protein